MNEIGEIEFIDSHCHLDQEPLLNDLDNISIGLGGNVRFIESRVSLQRVWSETSFHIQSIRDNSECAKQEYDCILDADDPGLRVDLSFDLEKNIVVKQL